jgi:hypothetical protein
MNTGIVLARETLLLLRSLSGSKLLRVSFPFGCLYVRAPKLSEEQLRLRFHEWDLNIDRQLIWCAVPYTIEITLASNMVAGLSR